MKQDIRHTVAALLLVAALPVFWLVCAFALPPQYDATFLGALAPKYDRLRDTAGDEGRIVVVGGSSVVFGLDSAAMQTALGRTVVNFGMYAGLGTTVMLDLSQPWLQAGDTVIVSPEQDPQTLSGYFGPDYLWQAADGAPRLLRLPPKYWAQLAGAFPAFASDKLRCTLQGKPQPDGVYAAAALTDAGDLRTGLATANTMPGGWDLNTPVRLEPSVCSEAFLDALNAYCDALTARGVTVYYHFPPMNTAALTADSDADAYYDWLAERLHCPILGDPKDSIMDAGWFYDTNFHLNESGRAANTRQWVRDLKAAWGDSSPTDLPLPAQPGAAEQQVLLADDANAQYVTWTSDGTCITITGLTEAGLAQTELTLPAAVDGLPVRVLAADALAGNIALQTVTLPASLNRIADGAFRGSDGLRCIVLLQADPAACTVGQHLLDGTAARLAVPQGSAERYKTNYFWSQYSDRIGSTHKK